ncbi:type II/III secretion system protein [Marinobacterium nitratireducens]|uniref:Type II/III secretion system protein n=1 Tax=Marinobacterium nitratireducens TaxID=518897 RepID=A0A917ZQH7_9GAMM|nr:type II and III secretion system protein family protein [Marinobacterium nitratireducens]GGO88747.1 type II/III secretion system protein [Marinobacterium nitratireducens]
MLLRILIVALTLVTVAPASAMEYRLTVGGQKTIDLNGPIDRVAVGEPDVAGVQVLSSRQLMVTGKGAGKTSLLIWVRGWSQPREYELQVYPDAVAVDNIQVQTDIKVVEVSKQALEALDGGFLFRRVTASGDRARAVGFNQQPLNGVNDLVSGSGLGIIRDGANRSLSATINALASNGFAYTLAEPSLVSLSGQPAFFLAGGEFPFPKSSDDGDISVDFKEFGIRLSLTPTVLPGERILLKVAPEVSELNFVDGLQAAGVSVPALQVRRTDTTVQLGAGESFIISGLVSRNTLKNVDKLPLLGDIPILGAFFRSTRLERNDKELLMIVTPYLVRPFARDAELPPLPGEIYRDYEPGFARLLFLDPAPGTRASMPPGMGFAGDTRP